MKGTTFNRDGKKVSVFIPENDSDEQNPDFIFSMTASDLLIGIATGKIDAAELARKELANRGTGKSGSWVGFPQAKKEWKVK